MEKIINEIIQAEHEARQITKEALLMKKNLQDDIKNEIEKFREKRFSDAKKLIEKINMENDKKTQEEIIKTKELYMQKIEEIQKSYEKNHEQWSLMVYNKLIGR